MEILLRYLGVSAFELITENKTKVLFDPYITNNQWSPIKVADLKEIDVVLVSHAAFDHLGDAFDILELHKKAVLVCGDDVKVKALQQGIDENRVFRISPYGGVKKLSTGLTIRAFEAKHLSKIYKDNLEYLPGWALGFVVYTQEGIRLYHTGDTTLFSDMKIIGQFHRPNILMLDIGALPGHNPVMTPFQASQAVLWINPDIVIPMHYDPKTDVLDRFLSCVKEAAPHIEVVTTLPGDTIRFERFKIKIQKAST